MLPTLSIGPSCPLVTKKMLENALIHPLWQQHKIGDKYKMETAIGEWKITYYPIFQDARNLEELYKEPRALVEQPTYFPQEKKWGIDFREIPLRYLTKIL